MVQPWLGQSLIKVFKWNFRFQSQPELSVIFHHRLTPTRQIRRIKLFLPPFNLSNQESLLLFWKWVPISRFKSLEPLDFSSSSPTGYESCIHRKWVSKKLACCSISRRVVALFAYSSFLANCQFRSCRCAKRWKASITRISLEYHSNIIPEILSRRLQSLAFGTLLARLYFVLLISEKNSHSMRIAVFTTFEMPIRRSSGELSVCTN